MSNFGFGDVNDFYDNYYNLVLRTGLIGKAQDQTHRSLERVWTELDLFEQVLEVGAGAGDHRQFVKHRYKNYYETDICFEKNLYERQLISNSLGSASNVIREYADFASLQYEDATFNRLIATCVLLHLENPELALREARRVTKSQGVISILVPCEPGILLRMSRNLLTARKASRLGFQGYNLFNARDHVSHFSRINELIKFVFRKDKMQVSRYPFRIQSWNLNLYYVYTIYRGEDE